MQNHREPSAPGANNTTPNGARTSTNNDANLLSHPLKRLSLHTAASLPLPPSPGLNSPRNSREPQRTPSSPGFPPNSARRSPSVVSLNRAASPALGRKSSSSSLRGELRGEVPGSPRPPASRRSSYTPNMPSPMSGAKSPLLPQVEEKPPLRACDIAEENFKRELESHEGENCGVNPGTIVIVHDQCYGHRFSRPKTAKGILSLIMERPERILASVLGISAAYVRLGERHSEGSNPLYPHQNVPERYPFKIRKTSRTVDITSQVVTNVHGTKWMEELKTLCDNAARKLASNGKELVRDAPTIPGQPPKSEFHSGDLYLCSESLNAFQGALGGVLDAVDAVFQDKGTSRAFVCVRPPGHHCSADWPSGFCWLNNVHVGIEHAMMNYGVTHAAIIDFDLHHGDGSQAITWQRNKKVQNMSKNTPNWKKTSIGYFSLHDINSYPCEEGDDEKVQAASLCLDQAHGQSIWNVHLQVWKTPEEFWQIYEERYLVLLEKTRQYLKFHTNRLRNAPSHPAPKAAIFLSAGFDASEWETAGMQRHAVNVPTEFYARFTRDVVRLAEEEGTGVGGRVISVLEGGYSNRALASGVFSHISGLTDGQVFTDAKPSRGLAFDMQQRLNRASLNDADIPMDSTESEPTLVTYDPQWWHASKLTELENLTDPPPVVVPKKVRNGPAAHFSSPTQSFAAKVVDPTKLHRQNSGRFTASPSRAPTPPPPEVDWATATHSLSKLLIPSDRQTLSYKAEELSEPRVKKEKPVQAPLASVHVDPSGRQLRGRKQVATYADPDSDNDKASVRAESRASRRKTIADFPLAQSEPPVPKRAASRRMSIASSVGSVSGEKSMAGRASSVATNRRSVTPATTASNGVQVKKARGTATATAVRVPKPPPVPRVPSNYMNKTGASKGKENDDMDALTTGLKRITLKMPSKEEYERREKEKEEKQKAVEAAKKPAAKTTTKKAPAARTTKAVAKSTTTKKAPSKPGRISKPPSPVDTKAQVPTPEPPKMQRASAAPLEQPQPIVPEQTATVIEQPAPSPPLQQGNTGNFLPLAPARRQSGAVDVPQPPTDLMEMSITPEQLPKPSFVTSTEPLPLTMSPPRPDTPPPPPPVSVPQFVNYTTQTFGSVPTTGKQVNGPDGVGSSTLQWMPPNSDAGLPTATSPTSMSRPLSAASKRQDLPIFTASGTIPFAAKPNAAPAMVTGRSTPPPSGDQHGTSTAQRTKIKAEEERDLWEVPDTPAH